LREKVSPSGLEFPFWEVDVRVYETE